jgi:hypothetical protein
MIRRGKYASATKQGEFKNHLETSYKGAEVHIRRSSDSASFLGERMGRGIERSLPGSRAASVQLDGPERYSDKQ